MDSIWPSRSIEISSGRTMETGRSLTDDQIQKIRDIVSARHTSLLARPIGIDEDTQLLALVVLGPDGIGSGRLLLRVTTGPPWLTLELKVISYGCKSGPGIMYPILPAETEGTLIAMVVRLREALGLS